MGQNTVVAPGEDNATGSEAPAKGETLLTGENTGTPPLAAGAPPQLPHEWMASLTAEQKADADLVKNLSKFEKGIPDLTKSYVELQNKLTQVVAVPDDGATDEQKARYRKARGVPEKLEDYNLEKVELPEGLDTDEAMQKEFLQIAHGAELNNAQLNAIHQWYMKSYGAQIAEARKVVKTTIDEATADLHKRHGVNADAAQTYMERGFAFLATPELTASLDVSGYGNHPAIVDGMIKLGKLLSEHQFVDGSREGGLEEGEVGNRSDEQLADVLYKKSAEQ